MNDINDFKKIIFAPSSHHVADELDVMFNRYKHDLENELKKYNKTHRTIVDECPDMCSDDIDLTELCNVSNVNNCVSLFLVLSYICKKGLHNEVRIRKMNIDMLSSNKKIWDGLKMVHQMKEYKTSESFLLNFDIFSILRVSRFSVILSRETMCQKTGISEKTIQRTLHELEKYNVIRLRYFKAFGKMCSCSQLLNMSSSYYYNLPVIKRALDILTTKLNEKLEIAMRRDFKNPSAIKLVRGLISQNFLTFNIDAVNELKDIVTKCNIIQYKTSIKDMLSGTNPLFRFGNFDMEMDSIEKMMKRKGYVGNKLEEEIRNEFISRHSTETSVVEYDDLYEIRKGIIRYYGKDVIDEIESGIKEMNEWYEQNDIPCELTASIKYKVRHKCLTKLSLRMSSSLCRTSKKANAMVPKRDVVLREDYGWNDYGSVDVICEVPNIAYALTHGKFESIDFHKIIADKSGVSREIAKGLMGPGFFTPECHTPAKLMRSVLDLSNPYTSEIMKQDNIWGSFEDYIKGKRMTKKSLTTHIKDFIQTNAYKKMYEQSDKRIPYDEFIVIEAKKQYGEWSVPVNDYTHFISVHNELMNKLYDYTPTPEKMIFELEKGDRTRFNAGMTLFYEGVKNAKKLYKNNFNSEVFVWESLMNIRNLIDMKNTNKAMVPIYDEWIFQNKNDVPDLITLNNLMTKRTQEIMDEFGHVLKNRTFSTEKTLKEFL